MAGAKGIVLVGRNKSLLEEPANAVISLSPATKVFSVSADLTREADVEALFRQAFDAFDTIHFILYAAESLTG
ncbi:hypothetical protein E8E13_008512 [Curvularia kusanoi]|uniref:Uncharacterized protein n=1 Tax=Curvularia kusanoi TaxID=90978 RepID=A0A9P4TI45_CURKU|nr:hypothetical protein E8E13_008512 [Curvularia kusanoi]